ncbi:hypothetical protein AN958_12055 [Leucoagaricus sp. SymC.cos]|nr:hypothetical protein AN958_12055 [Leucoagaricus sp. SymC.cos]
MVLIRYILGWVNQAVGAAHEKIAKMYRQDSKIARWMNERIYQLQGNLNQRLATPLREDDILIG